MPPLLRIQNPRDPTDIRTPTKGDPNFQFEGSGFQKAGFRVLPPEGTVAPPLSGVQANQFGQPSNSFPREPGRQLTASSAEFINSPLIPQNQAPEVQSLADVLQLVRDQFQPLSSQRQEEIRGGVAAQFAPQFAEQRRVNDLRTQLFGAQRAQAGETGFGTSGLGRENQIAVEQVNTNALNRLSSLQAAEENARIAAASSQNRQDQFNFLNLANQFQQQQRQEFQNFVSNQLAVAEEQRQRQQLLGAQAEKLSQSVGNSLVTVDPTGNIVAPTEQDIINEAARIGADPTQVAAAVNLRIDELRKLSREDLTAQANLINTQSLIDRRSFQTEREGALLPGELNLQTAKLEQTNAEIKNLESQIRKRINDARDASLKKIGKLTPLFSGQNLVGFQSQDPDTGQPVYVSPSGTQSPNLDFGQPLRFGNPPTQDLLSGLGFGAGNLDSLVNQAIQEEFAGSSGQEQDQNFISNLLNSFR